MYTIKGKYTKALITNDTMEDGSIGHWSLWLSDDDCCVLGCFWRTQSKESFESWLDKIFDPNNNHLDNGYLPVWHKTK